MNGRHDDPTPVKCQECGWEGRAMDCKHGYKPDGGEDVNPVDFCPECGAEEPEPKLLYMFGSKKGER